MELTTITHHASIADNNVQPHLLFARKDVAVSRCRRFRCWVNSLFFDSETNLGMLEAARKGECYALEGLFRGVVIVRQCVLSNIIQESSNSPKVQALVKKYFGFVPQAQSSSSSSPVNQPVAVAQPPHVNLQLLTAIEEHDTARALQLIDTDGVDVNFVRAGDAMTALHLAARTGNEVLLQRLLEKGAQLDAQDGEGNTFLHYAIDDYRLVPFCTRLLDKQGLDKTFIDISNQAGQTPLDRILWQQNAPIFPFACLLFRHGARRNIEHNLRRMIDVQLAQVTRANRAWYLREFLAVLPFLVQTHGPLVRNILNDPAVQAGFFRECVAHLSYDELLQTLGYIDAMPDDTILLAVYHKHGSRIARQLLPKVQSLSPRCNAMVQAAGISRYPVFNAELRFGLAIDLLRRGVMGQNATPLLIDALKEGRIDDAQAILAHLKEFIVDDYIDPDTQKSAVQLAAEKGIADILLLLINDQNAHTVTVDGEENTMLHLTVLSGDIASMSLTLGYLSHDEVNKTNRRGKTALSLAKDERVTMVLEKWGAKGLIGRAIARVEEFLDAPVISKETPILLVNFDDSPEVDLGDGPIREI